MDSASEETNRKYLGTEGAKTPAEESEYIKITLAVVTDKPQSPSDLAQQKFTSCSYKV